jgi:phosphosulfolactate phosphohydrolase-like enzyme
MEGWFKLKNKEKALVFVTDKSHIVYVPTTKGYSVMMSVLDADTFAASIRNLQ